MPEVSIFPVIVPERKLLEDNSFGSFEVPRHYEAVAMPKEGIYLRLSQNPPPRLVREALLNALSKETVMRVETVLNALWNNELPIFVVKWFMNLQGPANSRLSERTRFGRALWLIEGFRQDHYYNLLAGEQEEDSPDMPALPLFGFPPPVPSSTEPAAATSEPPPTSADPAATATSEPPPTSADPASTELVEEAPPRIIDTTPPWSIFTGEADQYIRGFGPVPCARVHSSRLNNLRALFDKLEQMHRSVDPSMAFNKDETEQLQGQKADLNALLTMARPRLDYLEAQEPEQRTSLQDKKVRLPVPEFILAARDYVVNFPVGPVHPSRLVNLSLLLERLTDTLLNMLEPEECESSEETLEVQGQREDLQALIEMARKRLEDAAT